MTIYVIFDNTSSKPGLESAWGFSALVVFEDNQVLFDTGGSGSILLSNMKQMELDPRKIDSVVLSHSHQDHTGGLPGLLTAGADPAVYLLPSFSSGYKQQLSSQVEVIEVSPRLPIAPRIYTSGEISGSPPEQALVLDTTRGLIVITGCAHPGVEGMVRQAKQDFKGEIYLVLGGFHLGGASPSRVKQLIREFRRMGVINVAPCHCTGAQAMAQFRQAYGGNYLEVGAGTVITLENQ